MMPSRSPQGSIHWPTVCLFLAFIALSFAQSFWLKPALPEHISYSELLGLVDRSELEEVQIGARDIRAKRKPSTEDRSQATAAQPRYLVSERIPNHDPNELIDKLVARGIPIRAQADESSWWEPLLFSWIFPIALLWLLWIVARRRIQKRVGPLSFGKSPVKIYDRASSEPVTFHDVAGVDEAKGELIEVVDFLREPKKYTALGAHIPKGVLLLGPPGTGKTLLAKAVAGEACVAFFSISGSEFVEMFVGVGAARIRDMFEQAKARAPCIVFIDELDALGKSRGGLAALGTNDEREQTLNQLLVEMDGFDASKGVVLMAATNRPEVLDPALMRAGRFDRQVVVGRPDIKGRKSILDVHARKIPLRNDVDLTVIAQRTPGMVGADLANLLNEGALLAARSGAAEVRQTDLEEALDRIQLGLKKQNRVMTEDEKRRVAYHESGHALVALTMRHVDPVHRVTIIPRSIGALGATLQLPTEEHYLMTRAELLDRLCVLLGGHAAEDVVFGETSTGAENDLERVAETARQMVCRFGMGHELGPLAYGRSKNLRFLEGTTLADERNFSEDTAQHIDNEVRAIVEGAYARAKALLVRRKTTLEKIASRLLEVETLERNELEALART